MAEFLPPDEMTLEAAGAALTARLAEGGATVRDVDRTFFDTFDGLLHEGGLTFVHEDGRLELIERGSGQELASIQSSQPTKPLMAADLRSGTMREVLAPVSGIRALMPLVHVHSRTRALSVLDDERKTVVRMTLEEPALVSSTGRHTALRPRVRVAVVRGYDGEFDRVQHSLQNELGFKPADQPLVDEAVRAAGGVPGGISSKVDVHLGYNQRADEAAARVLRRLLEVIGANLEGTIADIDTEFLHDLRVAVRRSRTVQRELRGVFPPDELAHFRAEFRWLQQVTGLARDLDVYVLEFDEYREMVPAAMRPELDPLLGVLRNRRSIARRDMVRALRSDRAATLRSDWASFLERLPVLPGEDRLGAAQPIGALAGERISKVYGRMVKMGGAIEPHSPPESYHELRKKGKELRYLLELLGAPVYPGEVVKPMIKALKALQDVLGRHQDREVQVATLRSLRDEISALPGGPAALMAMGVLIERLGEDERAARGEFASRFASFASRSQRARVKETFV